MSFVTDDHDRYTDPGPEFDRWLATHDREVAARALRGVADRCDPAQLDGVMDLSSSNFRRGLREGGRSAQFALGGRADAIEKGEIDV